ncbi:MAG: cytochrome C biogenesis protein, partial [Bacteroidetes bacterium]
SLIALTITVVYAYIEMRIQNRTTGYFILILPFFFQLCSTLLIKEMPAVPLLLRNNLLGMHVSTALFGFSALAISAVYGFLYLMLYHNIKSSHFGVIYNRLPTLEALERMSFTAIGVGFILLTVAIILGIVLLRTVFQPMYLTDPKLFGTIATWLLYAVGLTAKKVAGWSGRKIMVLSIMGFVVSLFSMTVINMLFSKFHNFQ